MTLEPDPSDSHLANRHQQAKRLFLAAVELTPEQAEAFLEQACGGDADLKSDVQSLLSNHRSGTLLESGAAIETPAQSTTPKSPATPRPPAPRPAGTMVSSRFRLVAPLGHGGMGVVYRAEDTELNQTVALKFLSPKLREQPAALEFVRHEVRIARQITHPNVVRIFDLETTPSDTFIAMEYVTGEDLESLVRRVGPLPRAKVTQIASQVAAGLAAAHDAGILHRDLKPANIMIDASGHARICDFGIAAPLDDERSLARKAGTPGFLAPELGAGAQPSAASDLYAWGVVIYYAATARLPRRAPSGGVEAEESPLYAAGLATEVVECVASCLEANPQLRPRSAHELLAALAGDNRLHHDPHAGRVPPQGLSKAAHGWAQSSRIIDGLMVATAVLLVLIGLLADRTLFLARCGVVKSPEALEDIAQQTLAEFGHTAPPTFVMKGLTLDTDCLLDVREQPDTLAAWQKVSAGEIPAVSFWYRQGDPRLPEPPLLLQNDRALLRQRTPGAALVRLDGRGRLLSLQVGESESARDSNHASVDWPRAFARTGLNWNQFRQVAVSRWPPLFADEVQQWEGPSLASAEATVTVVAAARNGRLVYLEVVQPWESAKPSPTFLQPNHQLSQFLAYRTAFWLLAFAAVAWLAWRHAQQGHAHWRGALRVAAYVVALGCLDWLCGARHSWDMTEELVAAVDWLAVIVFTGAIGGLAYVAVEPSARRGWPWSMVSLQRLLEGRLSDRGVWAEGLVGIVVGLAAVLMRQIATLLNQLLQISVSGLNDFDPGQDLLDHFGIRYKFAVIVSALLLAILQSLLLLAVILAVKRLFRSTTIAAAIVVFMVAIVSILGRELLSPIDWVARLLLLAAAAWLLLRFGLITSVAALATYYAVNNSPITLHRTAWFAPTGVFVVLLVLIAAATTWRMARPAASHMPR